jgi:uncharacterized protein YcaQ
MTLAVPRHAAAALFLERQHLDRPRARRLGAVTLERFARDTGGVQIDSVNVVDRAHLLTLWSRFGAFDRARLERLLYRRRVLFEYWAHAACFVPAADAAPWKRAMLEYGFHHTGWGAWMRRHADVVDSVEAMVRERGPVSTADFEREGDRPRAGWWDWKPAQHALHLLWMRGRVLVHSRRHFHKRYDLAQRVLPALATVEPPDAASFRRWHLERSLHAMGAATETDLRMYLTFPRTPAAERRATLRAALTDGLVTAVRVEGTRAPAYVLTRDVPALDAAARRRRPSRGTTLLSPFDSLLWHRERVGRLFGFDYRIEIYVPGPRRTHGYYVLPILHEGRLIGRADLRRDRAQGVLHAPQVAFEPWLLDHDDGAPLARWGAVDVDAALAGTAEALQELAAFGGTPRVRLGRVRPARLRPPLMRLLA